jgi:hypothetical protein
MDALLSTEVIRYFYILEHVPSSAVGAVDIAAVIFIFIPRKDA